MSYDSLFDFEIEIIIEVLTIKNLEQVELKDTKIELNFLGNKIEDEDPESLLLLTNGCHDVDLKFILKNKSETPKEEFLFCAFGNLLISKYLNENSVLINRFYLSYYIKIKNITYLNEILCK